MMKKRLLFALVCCTLLGWGAAQAQTVLTTTAQLSFVSSTDEVFVVYVDGYPYGDISHEENRQRVTLANLPLGVHDFTVRLVRPTDRVCHVTMDYQQQSQRCYVSYDAVNDVLSIVSDNNIVLPTAVTPVSPVTPTATPVVTVPGVGVMPSPRVRRHATDMEVNDIVLRMQKTSFENDRLQLAKTFVAGKHILSSQAAMIAKELNFDSKRLEFLMYAYDYCADRGNYYTTADVLTFNSNKKKLLKRIQWKPERKR